MSTEITINQDQIDINVDTTVVTIEAPQGGYPLPNNVYSVFGRIGNVVAQEGDYTLTQLGGVTITNPTAGQALVYNGTSWVNNTETYVGTVTSVNMSVPTGFTIGGNPITTAGTLALGLAAGYSLPTNASQTTWDTAYNNSIVSAAVTGSTSKTLTLNQQDGGTITASWSDYDTGLTSVGLSMPSAFTVSNSPLTSNGTLAVTGAGTGAQYIKGDGTLATFPTTIQQAQRLITEVYNSTGATLSKGTIVYINGGQGNLPTVTKAIASGDATSAQTYGVVQSDITNMNNGYVVVIGSITDLDTQAYPVGTQLYLSGTTAGAWTSTKPYAPIHLVYVGIVVRSHPTQGVVEVRIQNGYELDELHDVSAQNPNNGDILQYVAATDLWTKTAGTTTNIAEGTNLYYTDARSRAAFSESVTGLDYNSTTGVLSTTTGYAIPTTASQATWNTAYNDSIVSAGVTGTTTKTLTLNQQDGGTITASWTDYDTAPVTSVFGRTGAVIATSGDYNTSQVTENTNLYFTNTRARAAISETVIGLDYDNTTGVLSTTAGYGIPTTASQTNWDTAYTNRITSASAPLSIASNAISITQANSTTDGYLSSTDWNTFNNKQAAGNYITALTGEATASGPGSASVTLTNSAVIGKVLTGLNVTGGSVSATDSILDAFGKVQNQINGLIGGSIYQGVWNASTNTPTLTSSVGTKGYYYIVNVAGTTNLNGITDWQVGDWAIYDGTAWQKVDNTDAVSSVNGFTGAVSLTTSNISEGTNLYFTNTRAQDAITLTTTGTSGAATYSGGTLNIPQYQAVLTNPVTGTGTTNTLPKFTGTSAIGNSNITDDGSLITLGSNTTISSGGLGIGTTGLTQFSLRVSKNITGATSAQGIRNDGTVQSDVTNAAQYYTTSASTQATTFTLSSLIHYGADQSTFGAGSTITTQVGFNVGATLTGGTNIYGFRGLIASGTNRWNLYMDGTANNYLAGSLGIGSTSLTGYSLRVSKNITGQAINSGGSFGIGVLSDGQIQSDEVGGAAYYRATINTQAATFTAGSVSGYAVEQGTIGASSVISNQYGFVVGTTLIGATNNFGFASFIPAGTNRWNLYMAGTANNYMAGALGFNVAGANFGNFSIRTSSNITGNASDSYGIRQDGTVQSDVTTRAYGYSNTLRTQATAFTLTNYYHYDAGQATLGASSVVTNQTGFWVQSSMVGATNNYGFRGDIASGTNRWNLYMAGTAANYMAGALGIGTTAIGSNALTVNGTTVISGNAFLNTGMEGVRIGADTNSTTLTANTSKRGRINIPQYGNPSSLPIGIIQGSTDAANNSIIIGGIQGGFALAADIITFQIGATYNATTATEVARFNSAGSLGVGTGASINASAKVQIDSTTQGFLPPRMTAAQRTAISTPATGLMVYQTDGTAGLYFYDGSSWRGITFI